MLSQPSFHRLFRVNVDGVTCRIIHLIKLPSEPKVHHDRLIVASADHNVGGFEISVNHPVIVRFLKRQCNFANDPQDAVDRRCFAGLDVVGKRPPFNKGHTDVMNSIQFPDIVHRTEIGVLQRGR